MTASASDRDLEKSFSSSTFSEDQYNEDTMDDRCEHSATPKITAISSLKLAMSEMIPPTNGNNENINIQIAECDVVRAAIHFLGDLFCEFNNAKNSKTSRNSSHVSYKEHENESMDAQTFVRFLEEKLSLFGYTTHEIKQLFIDLKPQTPTNDNLHSVHFTEFNVVIHQFYNTNYKELLPEKSVYKKEEIYQLLLHCIKAKLQKIRNKLNENVSFNEPLSPINMKQLLKEHKLKQEELRRQMSPFDDDMDDDIENENPFLLKQPTENIQHSVSDISPKWNMEMSDYNHSEEEYDGVHSQMGIGINIMFGDSHLMIECNDGNAKFNFYEFKAPHSIFHKNETVQRPFSASTNGGNTSPLSLLSKNEHYKPLNIENPFVFTQRDDEVYLCQKYKYHYLQFFGLNSVYLTPQQLQFVKINPKIPHFLQQNGASDLNEQQKSKESNDKHVNIEQIAQFNTERRHKSASTVLKLNEKVNENEDLYDEDKKLASLLQSLSNINHDFVPNGLLTHLQFIEFIESLQIYNYDDSVLKHMFRYIYTEELPPTLPPPPIIYDENNEEDANYNNVNGMYVAYSECIGYEYDEMLELVQYNQNFDDLLTTMVVERLQIIYQTLKFDDLAAHPNQFLHRQTSFKQQQQKNRLNGDELKENVFDCFAEQTEKHHRNQQQNNAKNNNENNAPSTMRSTQSETMTYNHQQFRASIVSHDSTQTSLLSKLIKAPTFDKNTSVATSVTVTHHNGTPNTHISDDDQTYARLLKKGSSLNALFDDQKEEENENENDDEENNENELKTNDNKKDRGSLPTLPEVKKLCPLYLAIELMHNYLSQFVRYFGHFYFVLDLELAPLHCLRFVD